MRSFALLALWALPAAAAASGSGVSLQALTEADVGADALKNSACYAHDGPSVLLVATRKNAVVNEDGDLRLLRRLGNRGFPGGGARYGGSGFEIVISPGPGEAGDVDGSGRSNRSARISVVKGGTTRSLDARWSCSPSQGA
jgi:hypothetical protein